MDLICQKSELKCLDSLDRKSQIIDYYSYRNLFPLKTLLLISLKSLRVICFFFPHGATNSCGVICRYSSSKKSKFNRIKKNNQGRILILNTDIDEKTFVLITLYKKTKKQLKQNKLKLSARSVTTTIVTIF